MIWVIGTLIVIAMWLALLLVIWSWDRCNLCGKRIWFWQVRHADPDFPPMHAQCEDERWHQNLK